MKTCLEEAIDCALRGETAFFLGEEFFYVLRADTMVCKREEKSVVCLGESAHAVF